MSPWLARGWGLAAAFLGPVHGEYAQYGYAWIDIYVCVSVYVYTGFVDYKQYGYAWIDIYMCVSVCMYVQALSIFSIRSRYMIR